MKVRLFLQLMAGFLLASESWAIESCTGVVDNNIYKLIRKKPVKIGTEDEPASGGDGVVQLYDGSLLGGGQDDRMYNFNTNGDQVRPPYKLASTPFARPMLIPSGPHKGWVVQPTLDGPTYFRSPEGNWFPVNIPNLTNTTTVSKALFLPPDQVAVISKDGAVHYFHFNEKNRPVYDRTKYTGVSVLAGDSVVLKDGSIAMCGQSENQGITILRPNGKTDTIQIDSHCSAGGAPTPEGGAAFPSYKSGVKIVGPSGLMQTSSPKLAETESIPLFIPISVHQDGSIATAVYDYDRYATTMHIYMMDGSERCNREFPAEIFSTARLSDGSVVIGTMFYHGSEKRMCHDAGISEQECKEWILIVMGPNCTINAVKVVEDQIGFFPFVLNGNTIVTTGGTDKFDIFEYRKPNIKMTRGPSSLVSYPSSACTVGVLPRSQPSQFTH